MVVSEGADAPASRDDATGAIDVQSLGFLLGAAALWGTYPTCVKLLYRAGPPIDPAIVVLMRFIVMAAISVGALSATRALGGNGDDDDAGSLVATAAAATEAPLPWAAQLERRVPSSVFLAALELGVLSGLGTFCQTLSLSTIPALTAAVIYSTVNAFTPALATVAGATPKERAIDAPTAGGCALALFASAWALVPDGAGGAGGLAQMLPSAGGGGEMLMLAAAVLYAATKVRLTSHLRLHGADELATGRLVAQLGCAAAGLGLIDETSAAHELLPVDYGGLGESLAQVGGELWLWATAVLAPAQLGLIVASATLSGAAATWFQSKGQQSGTAPKAQVWFALTPLFGALWAFLVLGEQITFHEISGAALLLAAIGISALPAPEATSSTPPVDSSR